MLADATNAKDATGRDGGVSKVWAININQRTYNLTLTQSHYVRLEDTSFELHLLYFPHLFHMFSIWPDPLHAPRSYC